MMVVLYHYITLFKQIPYIKGVEQVGEQIASILNRPFFSNKWNPVLKLTHFVNIARYSGTYG